METLACIKRVPDTGAKIVLTDDRQDIDTSSLGFTFSPHEECGVEEAVSIVEEEGGNATVLTLGPEDATEQLRSSIAMGCDEGVLIETETTEWSPTATASELARVIDEHDTDFDLVIFGSESADAQNYQIGPRVAEELDVPCVTGIKDVEVEGDTVIAKRELPAGEEVYELDTPAIVTVKEGLNTPRYPSMRAKMQARQAEVEHVDPQSDGSGGLEMVELEVPETDDSPAEILGESADAAPEVVDVLEELEVI